MIRLLFVIIAFLILFTTSPSFALDEYDYNWVYELSDTAREIYVKKEVQVPCSQLSTLLDRDSNIGAYYAIRDAGIFKDTSCNDYFIKELDRIKKDRNIYDAYCFYRVRIGDESYLTNLMESFDKNARRVGDDHTVELFGFLSDWQKSGRRLVRHASYADGAAAELLCSAIVWRRFLYGEDEFKMNWFKIGHEEGVSQKILQYFYDTCK